MYFIHAVKINRKTLHQTEATKMSLLIQSISSVLGNITKIDTYEALMNKITWSEL